MKAVLKTEQEIKNNSVVKTVCNFIFKIELINKNPFNVYNEFINTYQQNKAMMLLQHKYIESMKHVVETTDENSIKRMIAIINKEIQNLPPKCQQVFILSKKKGLTNIEIAEHLDISIKTVEAQISKAFKILKEKLKDNYNMMLFLLFPITKDKLFKN